MEVSPEISLVGLKSRSESRSDARFDLGHRPLSVGERVLLRNPIRSIDSALALMVEIGDCKGPTSEVKQRQRYAIAALWRDDGWSVPKSGIGYWCEACGRHDTVKRRTRKAVWGVEVFRIAGTLQTANIKGVEAELKRWAGWFTTIHDGRVFRRVVLCRRCSSSTAKGICRHPLACDRLAIGGYYCAEHRTDAARYERSLLG